METSGRRFKIDGVNASGIATLMADAGLTNGAFYAHFASKDDLVAGVVAEQLGGQREAIAAPADSGIEQIVRGVPVGRASRSPRRRLPVRGPAR